MHPTHSYLPAFGANEATPPLPRLRRGYQTKKLLRGKGINDFFKARIAAERIPEGKQL